MAAPREGRRGFLFRAATAVAAFHSSGRLLALAQPLESGPSPAESEEMRKEALSFMDQWAIPGLGVAVAKGGRLVYDQAFGVAEKGTGNRLTTSHVFRIASVTKPITSAALLTLVESQRVSLQDPVFGPRGILGRDFPPPYRRYVEDVSLEHLLTHTAGGWQNDRTDPMFRNASLGHHELIQWAISELPLESPPGQHYAYSNFGYCVLGRVIEALSGLPYPQYVQESILKRSGISSMRLSGNTLKERAENEVVYEGQGEDPYSMNVRRMDSHGGWLATASDLVRFAIHVDGLSPERDILKADTIRIMTTPSTVNASYAKGWSVNPRHNWWHTGSLPGTSAILVRTASGFCWAALASTRREGLREAIDEFMWRMVLKVPSWRA